MKKEGNELIILGIVTLLATLSLSGCSELNAVNSEKSKLVGSWSGELIAYSSSAISQRVTENKSFSFLANGTFTQWPGSDTEGIWEINNVDKTITLTTKDTGSTVFTYEFLGNNDLALHSPAKSIFLKKQA